MAAKLLRSLGINKITQVQALSQIILGNLEPMDIYSTERTYNTKDKAFRINGNVLEIYSCLEDGVRGAFDSNKWEQITPFSESIDCGKF